MKTNEKSILCFHHFRFFYCALVRQAEQPIKMIWLPDELRRRFNMLNRPIKGRCGLSLANGSEHTRKTKPGDSQNLSDGQPSVCTSSKVKPFLAMCDLEKMLLFLHDSITATHYVSVNKSLFSLLQLMPLRGFWQVLIKETTLLQCWGPYNGCWSIIEFI